jgi:ATP-dependent Clp protease ATP-binding subunit ClpC
MLTNFTDRARHAMAAAKQESVRYRHEYVGTEHILLGLVDDPSGEVAGVLKTVGVDPQCIRQEIEGLIAPGHASISTDELPLTPRAQKSIEIAAEEARDLQQTHVDAGHLLLGLMREERGVAGRVLLNLGLKLSELREEVLKIRQAQMKLVERAVRPIPASATRKRKMREELLAHLSGIYEEEQARVGNPAAALREAAKRFGEPAALSRELASTLSLSERVNYYINRSLGWRAPESATHYTLRFATQVTSFVAAILCLAAAVIVLLDGGHVRLLIALRPMIAILPFMFVDAFLLGLLYFKLRDAICGAPWARKSLSRAIVREAMIALITFGTALAFNVLASIPSALAPRALYMSMAIAAVAAIVFPIVARVNGPDEIGDAVWASLDIDDSNPEAA